MFCLISILKFISCENELNGIHLCQGGKVNFLLTLPGSGQLQLGLWEGLELLGLGRAWLMRAAWGEAVCCGPGCRGLEGSMLVEVLHKHLDEASSCSGERILSSLPTGTKIFGAIVKVLCSSPFLWLCDVKLVWTESWEFYKGEKLWKMLGHLAYPSCCEQVWVGPWTPGPVFCCGFGTLSPDGWLRPSRFKTSQHHLPMRGQVITLPHNEPNVHSFLYASIVCSCFKSHLLLQETLLWASCLLFMAVYVLSPE